MSDILTPTELSALLKMSKGQIYEMTKERTRTGSMKAYPLPVLKINGNLRHSTNRRGELFQTILPTKLVSCLRSASGTVLIEIRTAPCVCIRWACTLQVYYVKVRNARGRRRLPVCERASSVRWS